MVIPNHLVLKIINSYPDIETISTNSEIIWRREGSAIKINRLTTLKDYINALVKWNLWGKACQFKFVEEQGVDEGGLTNEVFNLISTDLKNNFFTCKAISNNYCYYVFKSNSENCKDFESDILKCYSLIGKLIGKTIKEGYIININFSNIILGLLQNKFNLNSVADLTKFLAMDDPIYAKNLYSSDTLANPTNYETNRGTVPLLKS